MKHLLAGLAIVFCLMWLSYNIGFMEGTKSGSDFICAQLSQGCKQ